MKDYVEIIDNNGVIKRYEVIIRFYSEDNDTNYIVYKNNDEYYAAKYDEKTDISKMDTSLNEEELNTLEKLLNSFLGENDEENIN